MAMMDLLERAQICHDYIRALEEERNKIEVFQRELPLCLQLVTRAIESVRQQLVRGDERVKNGPVSEEFIPLRPSPTSKSVTTAAAAAAVVGSETKLDWLRSVQIWNRDTVLKVPPKKPIAVRLKKIGGGFQPFKREKYATAPAALAATQGSTITGCGGGRGGGDGSGSPGDKDKEKKEGECQPHRKARRCWSPELHRRFLNALHQLGGSHVATPKQIRELMKVDGLTHDEIKSHLQKYRLHNRRPSHADPGHSTPPTPQFVLVGGILVQPPDYAAAAAAVVAAAQPGSGSCAPPNGIYAPVASLP